MTQRYGNQFLEDHHSISLVCENCGWKHYHPEQLFGAASRARVERSVNAWAEYQKRAALTPWQTLKVYFKDWVKKEVEEAASKG